MEPESETHFLFNCEKLHEMRVKHSAVIPELTSLQSDIEKVKFLSTVPHSFSNFISELWVMRNNLISNNLISINNKSIKGAR